MEVGDNVKWTITKKLENGLRFTSNKAKILEINGEVAKIKVDGRIINVSLSELSKIGGE